MNIEKWLVHYRNMKGHTQQNFNDDNLPSTFEKHS